MLTVIFGAGASYDSDPNREPPPPGSASRHPDHAKNMLARPPLANELFADRPVFRSALSRFPQCQPLVPRLRHLGSESLEQLLARLQAEATNRPDPERAKQLAAVRFYLQTVVYTSTNEWAGLCDCTNYLTLLDDIRHQSNGRTNLVTFNYDCLLDDAVSRVAGVTPASLDDYLSLGQFSLFKVHGSVNWGRVVASGHNTASVNTAEHITALLIENAWQINVSDEYRIVKAGPPTVRHGDVILRPAIAVPVAGKQSFECPPRHIEVLKERLAETTRLLIIGWRGQDEHFVQLLNDHLADRCEVQVVCGSEDQSNETLGVLHSHGFARPSTAVAHSFSRYVVREFGRTFISGAPDWNI